MAILKAKFAGQIDFGAASGQVKNHLMQKNQQRA